jgi:hypothetical protein
MMRSAILAVLLAAWASGLHAQPQRDPEWPCPQRRVPTIAAASVWSGPDLAGAGDWSSDFPSAALAQKLASRRTPIEDVDGLIADFATAAGAERAVKLTRVFAGVLDILNTDRSRVLDGIGRYARGQARMAERIRDEADRITSVKDSPAAVPGQDVRKDIAELETRFAWDKRIFDERSGALAYVCEVPTLLEQRLGDIAARIQAHL